MATAVPGFPAGEFRAGIRLAMQLGAPPVEEDRPVFVFPSQIANDAFADESGVPFDPNARPEVTTPEPVQVPCAVEYDEAASRVENMGLVTPSEIKITLLDEDHARIRGFAYVVIAGDRYNYRLTEPPVGMDSVGVWTVHCVADDDS